MFFEMYRSGIIRREWRWRLKSANGRIIADSGEGYTHQRDCRSAIALVQNLGPTAAVREIR